MDPVQIALGIAAMGAAGTAIVAGFRAIRNAWRPIGQAGKDWHGEEERPGVARRPGLMERLAMLERIVAQVAANESDVVGRLARIETEVKYNGGDTTLADAVRATRIDIDHLKGRADTNDAGIQKNTEQIEGLSRSMESHASDGAEFLGQALSELAEHDIHISPPHHGREDADEHSDKED